MKDIKYATPIEAEEAFYEAFAKADLEMMQDLWLHDDSVVCIHPMSAALVGWDEVTEIWGELFSGGPNMSFEIIEPRYTQDGILAIHIVQENITLIRNSERQPPVMATNIYQLTDEGWRMTLHHASPVVQQLEDSTDSADTPTVLH